MSNVNNTLSKPSSLIHEINLEKIGNSNYLSLVVAFKIGWNCY